MPINSLYIAIYFITAAVLWYVSYYCQCTALEHILPKKKLFLIWHILQHKETIHLSKVWNLGFINTVPLHVLFCSQMLNSLRSLRNSAAKKRAKVSLSSPDVQSPDSAMRSDLGLDSLSHSPTKLISSTSESGLSSLSSVTTNSSSNGIKSRWNIQVRCF